MRRILRSRRHLATALVAAFVAVLAPALWLPGDSGIASRSRWRLVLDEGFRGHRLDARWRTCFWWASTTCSIEPNRELQLYTPGNVSVAGGALTLSARRQSRVGWNGRTYAYTSGMVMSGRRGARGRPGFAFTYGRAEARIKVPRGAGLLPAFWLLPASGASRPEIDVVEILGGSPHVDRMHIHYAGRGGRTVTAGRSWRGPDFSAGWHTFAVDWEPRAITWSVDGVRRWRVTRPAAIPRQPMYLLLTLAVGGEFPGPPDGATVFPNDLRVASVRVWQHPRR